ncbi:autotransporter outer membrane beta-barrel domain-containing protein [Wohlfahrtiimonas sp. G9077]|uniref:autotransporter outer membrane beta-barrel domain-containing protein n=1 Tax=Wohlfahrtiimonas sp. G9077 TaxID=1980118 RepID=UPI001F3797CD|nr:autotransporter outer membrane beta-barrel domain-containing protein [Wohlfahrtiimonas sp. G9077]
MNSKDDFSLNNHLTGTGLLDVKADGNSFNFGNAVGKEFAGTVNLENSIFDLKGNNTNALTNATLVVGNGNITTVDTANQTIGNLTLQGGQTVFNGKGSINTNTLANNGASIIKVDLNAITPTDGSAANLLDQNKGQHTQLITAKNNGDLKINELTLQKLDGSDIGAGTIRSIDQNGQTVAKGTYNYALNKTGGLGVSYGLSALEIADGQTLALDATNATNKNMTAIINGKGNLTLTSDATGLILTNDKNAYTGATNVTAGLVTAGSDNAFGHTSSLNLAAKTTVNLNGKTQTVGSLTNAGSVDLAGGSLTVTNANGASSTSTGILKGNGDLSISAGDLSITKANTDLNANIAIDSGAAISLSGAGTLGSSQITLDGDLNLNADTSLGNNLAGNGSVNTKADVTLTGNNAGFTGTQNIGNNASVTVANQAALGSGQVSFAAKSSQLNLNGITSAVQNVLSGAGIINISEKSAIDFSADNQGFDGTFVVDGASSLTTTDFSQLGKGSVSVVQGGAVNLDKITGELTNIISGDGNLNLSGTNLLLNSGNIHLKDLTGAINITKNSNLTLAENGQLNDAAKVNITAVGDSVTVNSNSDFSFNNNLVGSGLLNVQIAGNSFNFGKDVGSDFAGTVNLSNSAFNLSSDNTTALKNATLVIGQGNTTTVDTENQAIGNLTLEGGQTVFNGKGSISTDTLANNGASIIKVDLNAITPTSDNAANLLDQNSGQSKQLITAKNNDGLKLSDLMLQELNGSTVGTGTIRNIDQNDQKVAEGTYNYALNKTDGLGISYGLSALNIVDGQTLTLDATSAANKNMTATLTGAGNLVLISDDKGLTLTNEKNAYTGATNVTAGLVTAGSNNAFGQTSQLNLAAGTTVDLNSKTQIIGILTNEGKVDFAGGTLTITNANGAASTSSGELLGTGSLIISAGDLSITSVNNDLAAEVAINSGAAISLSGAGTLGSSQIALEGDLNLNSSTTFSNQLAGNGSVNTKADVTLTGDNAGFTGTQNIGNNASVTVANQAALGLGKVNFVAESSKLNLNGVTSAVKNVLHGAGSVNIGNNAAVNFSGNNAGFTGTFAIDGTSQLTATNFNQLGKGSVQVAQDGAVHLNNITSELTNAISGAGNLNLAGTDLSLNTGNVKLKDLTGSINLTNASSLTLVETGQLNDAAKVNIAAKGDRITVNSKDDFSLNNHLIGTGLLDVKADGNSFNFGNAVGNAFAGTVNLENSIFTLGGSNTDALTNATLVVGNGNITTVDTADQTIGNLTLQGGQTVFNGKGSINTNILANNGASIIKVDLNAIAPTSDNAANLLDQNKGQHTQLITAKDNGGLKISDLTLQKLDGSEIGIGTIRDVNQNGQTVAKGTYNYALNNTDGLGVNYGLSALEIADGQTLVLDVTNATNKEMMAAITGSGDLTLTSDDKGLTLTNDKNAYTGATTITAGLVTAGSDNAFGHTSSLNLAAKTTVNLNGKAQTVGSLTNAGSMDLAGGSLTLMNGGQSTSDNGLLGAGKVTVTAGNLSIEGKNDALTADVAVNSGAAISLSGAGTLGSSKIALEGDLNLNADTSLGNNLAGNGSVNTKADVTLTGDNSGFTGTQNIGNNASVTVANQAALGSGQVSFAAKSSQLNLNGITSAVQNVLRGAGIINISEKSAIDFSADNQGFTGTFAIDGTSQLTATNFNQLGKGSVQVAQDGVVHLNNITSELTNAISGAGNLNLAGTDLSLNTGNVKLKDLRGSINLTNASSLTLVETGQLNDAAKVNIAAKGDRITVNSKDDFSLNNHLTGTGLLDVKADGNSFNFGNAVGKEFAGTVNLENSIFDLKGNNTSALTNATLVVGNGNITTVDTADQTIGNLTLQGGQTVFNGKGSISTDTLANNGASIIKVDLNAIAPTDGSAANLLDQNKGQHTQLITAKDNSGLKISDLTLQKLDGSDIGAGTIRSIDQNGQTVAKGTYNYALNKTGGLGVNYGLSALEIADGQTLALDATNATNKNMTAAITGSGDLTLTSNDKGLTLTNEKNAYTGATNVTAGLVTAGSDNAFGHTSSLNLSTTTTVDLNGKTQTVGSLTNAGSVDLAGGSLTLMNGGQSTSDNGLLGAGKVTVTAGNLSIEGKNDALTADVAINSGAAISLSGAGTLGTSQIALEGDLNLNSSTTFSNQLAGKGTVNTKADVTLTGDNSSFAGVFNINDKTLSVTSEKQLGTASIVNHGALDIRLLVDGQLVNTMTGTGDFIKSGHGTLSVTNELLHTGQTQIHEGTLFLEKGAVLGGAQSVGSVHIAKDATLAGSGTINQRVYNDGTIDVNLNGVRQGRASAGGNAKLTINQDVYNNNKIYIGSHHTAAGNQLIINGNYIAGENAVLYMNTDLGNSSTSVVDQLIVSGDASGKTQLHITDLGNVAGGMTSPLGVKIIETGTSDAQAFALQNAVIKGIYEYELKQNENDQDWYLTSYRELYRPDVGSAMANSMGTMRAQLPGYGAHTSGALAAGSGGLRALNRNMTADGQYLGSVWFNETGTHDEGDIAGNQIHYSYKGFASVLGADTGFRTGNGLVIIGGMISTSSMDSKGWNRINESRSTGSIKGHAFGVYGSWFKNADDALSPFIDYTISYGRYDNTVKTLNNASSAYDSRLWTVSVQGGYPMAVGENLVIEPQAQISYIDYKVDSYRDFNGTQITEKQNGHVISRVGAYIYPKTGDVKPYAAMNLWYDDVSSKVSYDDRSLSSGKPGLFYEAKLGVQAKMSDHFTINAEANYRQGKHKHKNYNFNVGFKYQF